MMKLKSFNSRARVGRDSILNLIIAINKQFQLTRPRGARLLQFMLL